MHADDEPNSVSLEIGPNSELPDVCLQCGQPTHRTTRVTWVGPRPPALESEQTLEDVAVGCLLASIFPLGLLKRRAPSAPVARLRVPHCRDCGRGGKPTPRSVDVDRGTFRFDVHPRFRDWVEQTARRSVR